MQNQVASLQSPFERLPAELLRPILCAIPDILSLRSAALSCRSFYGAICQDENEIVISVLCHELGSDVLPEAIAAHESSLLQKPSDDSIGEFTAKRLSQRKPDLRSWTIRKALPLVKFHAYVRSFATRFKKGYMTEDLPISHTLISAPPTPAENGRIERSFYRFEIFCNLFRHIDEASDPLPSEAPQRFFFPYFAPWENEQLGCVHDFLVREISPGK